MGNMTSAMPASNCCELLRSGRMIKLRRELHSLSRVQYALAWRARKDVRTVYAGLAWQWVNETFTGHTWISWHTPRSGRTIWPCLIYRAGGANSISIFPIAVGRRLCDEAVVMRRVDIGNHKKGILAGSGIDRREPLADKRLVEYCLSIQRSNICRRRSTRLGQARLGRSAAASRPQRTRKGYQAIDWHEGLTAPRRLGAETGAAVRLRAGGQDAGYRTDEAAVENWPTAGWERQEVRQAYRLALLRGIAAATSCASDRGKPVTACRV